MCLKDLFSPKIPKTEPMPTPPKVVGTVEKPEKVPEAQATRGKDDKATVTYGDKAADALKTGAQTEKKKAVVPLNRSLLNTPGANQGGLGGTTT